MTQPIQESPITEPEPNTDERSGGLLDLHFTRFLSLGLISVWWVTALFLFGLGGILGVIGGLVVLAGGDGEGVLLIIGSLIGGLVAIVLTRLFLELIAVLFRIADNTSAMVRGR